MTSKEHLNMYPTPLERHEVWLKEVALHYGVHEGDITARRKGCALPEVAVARQTFYWLCWRDRINLPRLSVHLGKHRSLIGSSMAKGLHNRQKHVEDIIYEEVTTKERKLKAQKDTSLPEES